MLRYRAGTRRPHVVAVVLAGGEGSRLDVLTRERAEPAVPFADTRRLIDVPLSNLAHSGISDVLVAVPQHASTLDDVIADGRPWDLDRTRGGLRLAGPQTGRGGERSGLATGNADVLLKLRPDIRTADPDAVLVLSSDHVYACDFRDVVDTHLSHDAAATVVTTLLSKTEAVHHATVEAVGDEPGARVTRWDDKPPRPSTARVSTEIFVYDPQVLFDRLADLHARLGPDAGAGDSGLGDVGERLLPALVADEHVVAHPLPGYWRDAGRPDSYLRLHRDLLAGRVDVFADPARPLLGPIGAGPGARLPREAEISFVGRGSVVGAGIVLPGGSRLEPGTTA